MQDFVRPLKKFRYRRHYNDCFKQLLICQLILIFVYEFIYICLCLYRPAELRLERRKRDAEKRKEEKGTNLEMKKRNGKNVNGRKGGSAVRKRKRQ